MSRTRSERPRDQQKSKICRGDHPAKKPVAGTRDSLSPAHWAALNVESGISADNILANGYYTEESAAELAELGFDEYQCRTPALVLPVWGIDGVIVSYQIRPDKPRKTGSKLVKYETPAGSDLALHVPPGARAKLADPACPLIVTEGIKKADAGVSAGLCAVALPGVGTWHTEGIAPVWGHIPLKNRLVYICFDSDAVTKADVQKQQNGLAAFLSENGASVRIIILSAGENGAKTGLDDYLAAGHSSAELFDLSEPFSGAAKPPARSQSTDLVALADSAELFHNADGCAYASYPVGDHRETDRVRSGAVRLWLRGCYFRLEGKPPGGQALDDALGVLEARARFEGPECPVYIRLAKHEGAIYIDLANDTRQIVRVDAAGWEIENDSPVRFRRTPAMMALPTPAHDGSAEPLRHLLNLADESDWALLLGWMSQALCPTGPYPILELKGEAGAGKTTAARMIRALIDPNRAPVRSEPRETRDLAITAENCWLPVFDNLSGLPASLSDALCRLSTGGGFATRSLYENDAETIMDATRPVILTGIEGVVERGDLVDRTLAIELPAIPRSQRRAERELQSEYTCAAPGMFGALLTRLSGAIRELQNVRLPERPRMADFAEWAVAAEIGAGEPARFLAAYAANQNGANDATIEYHPIGRTLLALLEIGPVDGTASKILAMLNDRADADDPASGGAVVRRLRGWPTAPNKLAGALKRLSPNLRAAGFDVDPPVSAHSKSWSIRKRPESIDPIDLSIPQAQNGRDSRIDSAVRIDHVIDPPRGIDPKNRAQNGPMIDGSVGSIDSAVVLNGQAGPVRREL